jgi:hypothetical protein
MSANGSSEPPSSLNQAADSGHQGANVQQLMERQVGGTVNNVEPPNAPECREGNNREMNTQGTAPETRHRTWHDIFSRRETTSDSTGRSLTDNGVENLAWGHALNEKDPQHTRLYSVNVNGLSIDRDGGKFDEFCQVMDEVQSDIGCVQEHNLDTTQHQVKSQLYATAQRRWQWRKLTVTSTPVQFAKTYKPGGTLMISVNSLSS